MAAPQSSAQPSLTAAPSLPQRQSATMTLTGSGLLLVWFLSIAVHLFLLAGMFALVFPYGARDDDSDLPIAKTEIVGSLETGSFSSSASPNLTEAPSTLPEPALEFTPKPPPSPIDLAPSTRTDLSIVGIGSGGDLTRLGLSIGASTGPRFFGLGTSAKEAKHIVYVVDRRGSMIGSFEFVQQELRRSIGQLRRSQKFHVIFFNSGRPLESPPRRLVGARDKEKEAFFAFLNQVSPSGGTEPASAIQRALSLEPDIIYLLSDGMQFDPHLLQDITAWNAQVKAKIFTIAYVDRTGREILEKIARDHGGEFTFVSDDDLR